MVLAFLVRANETGPQPVDRPQTMLVPMVSSLILSAKRDIVIDYHLPGHPGCSKPDNLLLHPPPRVVEAPDAGHQENCPPRDQEVTLVAHDGSVLLQGDQIQKHIGRCGELRQRAPIATNPASVLVSSCGCVGHRTILATHPVYLLPESDLGLNPPPLLPHFVSYPPGDVHRSAEKWLKRDRHLHIDHLILPLVHQQTSSGDLCPEWQKMVCTSLFLMPHYSKQPQPLGAILHNHLAGD